jgi:hypothetical protein
VPARRFLWTLALLAALAPSARAQAPQAPERDARAPAGVRRAPLRVGQAEVLAAVQPLPEELLLPGAGNPLAPGAAAPPGGVEDPGDPESRLEQRLLERSSAHLGEDQRRGRTAPESAAHRMD